jgi:hypothetical protein
MIKALFLIFEPSGTWERIAEARRGIVFVFGLYLLPLMVIAAAAEAFGLIHWGTLQVQTGVIKKLTVNEAVVYETAQSLLMLLIIVACGCLIKSFSETFHSRHKFQQAFTLVIYGLSPVFMLRVGDMFQTISPWLTWGIGIMLTVKLFYSGVPCMMVTDPTHALGLYFMSSLVVIALTGAERFFTAWYLTGHFLPLAKSVSQLAERLPF